MGDKEEAVFVLGATSNLDFATANVIAGIDKHIKGINYDIVVFEQGFSENAKNAINKIHPTKFIPYEFPIKFDTQNSEFANFTILSFSIYECLNLLEDYKQSIWLDCDVMIQKDFSDVIKNNNEISVVIEGGSVGEKFKQLPAEVNPNALECNSGVVFFSDAIKDYKNLADWCYNITVKYSDVILRPDQTVLSMMFDKFNLSVNSLPTLYNSMPFNADADDAFIIHTNCPAKLWNGYYYKEWEDNNKLWEKYSGSKLNIKKDNIFVRKARTIFKNRYDFTRRPKLFVQALFNRSLNFR